MYINFLFIYLSFIHTYIYTYLKAAIYKLWMVSLRRGMIIYISEWVDDDDDV